MNFIPLLQKLLLMLGFTIPDEELAQGEAGPGTREAVRQVLAWPGLPAPNLMVDTSYITVMILASQHLLTMLGIEINDDERWQALPGDSTREAIRRFQDDLDLEETGEPDGNTLNALLERAGNGRFTVTGKVADSAGNPFSVGLVQAQDVDATSGVQRLLGEAGPGENGSYKIEYSVKQLRELGKLRADLVVKAQNGRTLQSSDVIRNARAIEIVDLTIPAAPTAECRTQVVSGKVRREDGLPLPGVRICAFHVIEQDAIRLGEDIVDAEGSYTIRYDLLPGQDGVNLRVAAYNNDRKKLADSGIISNAQPLQFVNLTVGLQEGSAGEQIVVSGVVASRTSTATGGLLVRIVDKGVGEDFFLAETTTDGNGAYRVSFSEELLHSRGKEQPDLQARVFSGQIFLAASAVKYNASQRETLDVQMGAEASTALRSEHEALTSALSGHFTGRLADLQETDDIQDLTYLANKTGWDARAVALTALADQFSERSVEASASIDGNFDGLPDNVPADLSMDPGFFYALFRAGLPANAPALYQANPKTVEAIWQQSISQGVISPGLAEQLPQALDRFQLLAAREALDSPALAGASSLKEIITVSLGDDLVQQQKLADLYVRHQDPQKFWGAVRESFGEPVEKRLRVDGQLAYLTLNNAPLVQKLHAENGQGQIENLRELIQKGYYTAQKWQEAIAGLPIPPEIPGQDEAEKHVRYADLLAAQFRLSYPTTIIAHMVETGQTPVSAAALAHPVVDFLAGQEEKFEIGMQPIEQYVKQNNLQIDLQVVQEITRIQRIYQVTPGDEPMNALLNKGLDSAYAITRFDQDNFVRLMKNEVGGEQAARRIHNKSQQVHNAVLNVLVSYLTASNAPGIGVHSPAQIVAPTPAGSANAANAGDVIAYSTLEGLFGELDYCTCDHCRSILSPAAYMVDLLLFVDQEQEVWDAILADWRLDHDGAPYPFLDPQSFATYGAKWNEQHPGVELPNTEITPLGVLLARRPDLQHLPLTCENTNLPVPYIDLVNEMLEYYVTNGLDLTGYTGHTTDENVTPQELLANPQHVTDQAYAVLAGHPDQPGGMLPLLPPTPPLPFHRPLEVLRRYFERFEAPLPLVMESLRKDNSLERSTQDEYAWRDIWMEELRLSRPQYRLLTDSDLTLQELYGFPPSAAEANVLQELSNAKAYTRKLGITYEELIEILKTRFVNPNSTLIPRLERLGVSFTDIKRFKDGEITGAEFDALVRPRLASAPYGGNIQAWIKDDDNYRRIMSLITLLDPEGTADLCSFDRQQFRYSDPALIASHIRPFEFVRLLRFIRLWKDLGWTIEQTDKALTALYPKGQPIDNADHTASLKSLDVAFLYMLPRLGIIKRLLRLLKLKPKKELQPLLALFAPIGTHGANALYRQMFLSRSVLAQDPAFADDGYGGFLTKAEVSYTHPGGALEQVILDAAPDQISYDDTLQRLSFTGIMNAGTRDALKLGGAAEFQAAVDALYAAQRMLNHTETLRSAFQLTGEEFSQITHAIGFDANSPLAHDPTPTERDALADYRVEHISAVYRRNWLARALKLSVSEFLLLTQLTGLDPFSLANPADPAILRLIDLVSRMRQFGLKPDQALALVWNQDLSGRATADEAETMALTRSLRSALTVIETEFSLHTDPEGRIARERMALVYGPEATDQFFGLLENTLATDVPYSQAAAALDPSITLAASGRVRYDDFRKRLSFTGVLSSQTRDDLMAAAGASPDFKVAVQALYTANQAVVGPFFERFPELLPLHDAFAASAEPVETKRAALLANFLPELIRRRKSQQALQTVSASAGVPLDLTTALLNNPAVLADPEDFSASALEALTAAETPGISVQFFFSDTAGGVLGPDRIADPILDYNPGSNPLPANPVPGSAISGIWSGFLEAPETAFFKLRIETDPEAKVTLKIAGQAVDLTQGGGMRTNISPVELRAGVLVPVTLQVEKVTGLLSVRWEVTGRGWEIIPPLALYPAVPASRLRQVYLRFLKAAALTAALHLTPAEITYLAAHPDYQIDGRGWLNSLPTTTVKTQDFASLQPLLAQLDALLDFTSLKAALSPKDERLLQVLKDPLALNANGESLLLSLTRWETASLDALLVLFGKVNGAEVDRRALQELETFCRVYDAYTWVKQLGVPASALAAAATNEPSAVTVRDFQAALRSRYAESDWLTLLQPINDEIRRLQRNALVAYVLHQMRSDPVTAHIDTADKLFEFFLMDVQMEPCTQTSRIRHALSSVQLFIERCLMNLEPRVNPSILTAQHWEWMKRYRVWEANRKCFLYPENWLEPELRDDQSPFFRETMSELLQSDITEATANTALLNYLSKLEEVARLEPCGLFFDEKEPGNDEDDIIHVVARTPGANRKYYYRKNDYGSWTPWEQIKLDIEDNPVIPVVWKNRLFLFWVKIIQQAILNAPPPPPDKTFFDAVDASTLISKTLPSVNIQVVLCWSEFYNGKWQPTKTSDMNMPPSMGIFPASETGMFTRSRLRLSAYDENGALRLYVHGNGGASFLLYNTYSMPHANAPVDSNAVNKQIQNQPVRWLNLNQEVLSSFFYQNWNSHDGPELHRVILKNPIGGQAIDVNMAKPTSRKAPFFYEDRRHVFYVTTRQKFVTVQKWERYVPGKFDGAFEKYTPKMVMPELKVEVRPQLIPDLLGPVVQEMGIEVFDPQPAQRFVTEDVYIHRGIDAVGTVRYGVKDIGPAGSLAKQKLEL